MRGKNEILQKFRNIPKELEIVCVGTTQAHFALDFSGFPIQGFNMAAYRNPIVFHRLLLEKNQERLQKNAVVLITLEYPILCIDCFEEIARKNAVQYAKLLPGRNPYLSRGRQLYYYFFPVCLDKQMQNFLEYKSVAERNRYVNHYKPWELDGICGNLVKNGWEKEIKIAGYVMEGHQRASEKAELAMKRARFHTVNLIRFCREKGWRPVLVGLPYSKVLNDYIPDSFKRKCFYNNIDYLQKRTSCEFLDYSADERMQDIHNYMDVWFLNERGRQKFTGIVLEDL